MSRNETRRTSPAPLVGLLALAALAACAETRPATYDETKAAVVPAAALTYENINPAITMATAYGDKARGAHGTFGRFPAEFTTPFHTHSGAYHGIVVKGVMTNPFDGEANPPAMKPGSYWYVPAGARHATACVSEEPCEFYFYADRAFDFEVAE